MYKIIKVQCVLCTKPYTLSSLLGIMPRELACPECYAKGVARCYHCGWLGYATDLKKEDDWTCPKCASYNID